MLLVSLQAKFHFEHVTQSIDCNPDERRALAELDQKIAVCKEEANWLEMFRLLLWKGQLQQVVCLQCTRSITTNL